MKIGINSDLNIPVRRSTQKHNFGSCAVKLPHSGVETQNNNQENKAKQAKLEKQAETKEVQVPKSEKSDSDRESGEVASKAAGVASKAGATAELEKAKLRAKTVSNSHENNLNVLIIIAGGLAWFLFR